MVKTCLIQHNHTSFSATGVVHMASISASLLSPRQHGKHWVHCIAALGLLVGSGVQAGIFEEGDVLTLQAAPGAIHYSYSADHAKFSWLVGLEWQSPSRWVAGASYFNNSFDQKCEYFYVGKSWPLEFISNNVYFKLTGGLLLGYKEPYENKVPFNHNGVAPGIIPGLGYKYGDFNVQLNALGTAGMMITFGYDFLK
ncbi:MAG: hypothetical protein U1F42_00650 [Candidatus Competibacteraceae bacterium]